MVLGFEIRQLIVRLGRRLQVILGHVTFRRRVLAFHDVRSLDSLHHDRRDLALPRAKRGKVFKRAVMKKHDVIPIAHTEMKNNLPLRVPRG